MLLSTRQTRFFFLMYILIPFVAGIGHLWQGTPMIGWAYLFVTIPYLLAYGTLPYLSKYSILMLQALGALMMLVIGADYYQQGNHWLPVLLVLAAGLNIYVFWAKNRKKVKS
ncbi:MAG: hypothetical protein MUD08_07810 [Cytophagales bacterium]|jgi:hypothetical protein|nr:hypothetical protein [Cytophagales bacterium]